MSYQVYTHDEFLNKMSYLFPIAANFLDNKTIQVPINEKSTIASLQKLFKKENINNEDHYGYNLWHTSPQKFVSIFLYNYWSDDPLMETNIDLNTLSNSSFPVKQYISLSLINSNNKNNDSGLIYDIDTIQFNNLDELIELFQYMSSLSFVDYTQTFTNVLGNVTSGVNSRSHGEIKSEEKTKYNLEDEKDKIKREQQQHEFEQKIVEAGLVKPSMNIHDITLGLMNVTIQFNELYLRELKIRRDFAKRDHELVQSWQTRMSEESALSAYLTERETLVAERKAQITIAYENLNSLYATVDILKKESASRDAYDKLLWGNLSSSLSQSLENLNFDFDTIVLVEDAPASTDNKQTII